jgi:site-specific DNA-cytosine methylase
VAIIYGDTPSGLPRQQDKLYSKLGISPTIATFSIPPFDADGGWRILAPRECARLQGFPDSFRLHRNDQVAYKQVGNAVTVDVVAAILTKMLEKAG